MYTSAGENTLAVFDSLVFTIEDLAGAQTRDFVYRIHEVIPDAAQALDAQGNVIKDESGNPLTYAGATPEQKASAAIRWHHKGVAYAADRIVTVRVSLTEKEILQVSTVQD